MSATGALPAWPLYCPIGVGRLLGFRPRSVLPNVATWWGAAVCGMSLQHGYTECVVSALLALVNISATNESLEKFSLGFLDRAHGHGRSPSNRLDAA